MDKINTIYTFTILDIAGLLFLVIVLLGCGIYRNYQIIKLAKW